MRNILLLIAFFGLNSVFLSNCLAQITIELGAEEKVFEYVNDHCSELDLPDVYAHPIRTKNGIMLVSGNAPDNYFMFGKDFNSLKRSCTPVLRSGDKWEVDSFDHQEWITSVYSEDGITIHALVHNEYHDPYSRKCKQGITDPSNPCWYNFITYAKSTDGGKTFFQQESPDHLVAMLPFKWNPDAAPRGAPPPHGYMEPSNIVKHGDYFYSIFFGITSNIDQGISGTCIMRTDNLSQPSSWKIWDGKGFNIPLINPYTNPPQDSSKYVPAFIGRNTIRDLRGSLTWNSYLKKFMLVGAGVHQVNGMETCGFFFSMSDDLINWTLPQLIRETILGWSPCNRQTPDQTSRNIVQEAYPSLIDHDASDISFTTVDSTAYLYFMQNMDNWKQGGWGLRRDLVRIPIKFIKEEISRVVEIQNTDSMIQINPNPASEYIEISLGNVILSEAKNPIKVFNTFGEIVINYELQITNYETIKIDISLLQTGLYFIQIGNYTEKFMVVR
jgi:hypothetical protein